MNTTLDYFNAPSDERAEMLANARRTHRGVPNIAYEAALATRRARAAIEARAAGLPRPVNGTHRGEPTDA